MAVLPVVHFGKMNAPENPPRSPFAKGEDDLFDCDVMSCDPPFGKGGQGGFSEIEKNCNVVFMP
jgi:hypothetical protein